MKIGEKIRSLPAETGVYEFKDRRGRIIYVGKANSIRNRVQSHFSGDRSHLGRKGGSRTALSDEVADIDYVVTGNELDALTLEAALIKQWKPRYNVRFRDDKSYPYLKITLKDPYPRIMMTRRPQQDGAKYIGPFTGTKDIRRLIKLTTSLFQIRTCDLEIDGRKFYDRPCLQYHLKLCTAPCVDYISKAKYSRDVKAMLDFFSGRFAKVIKQVKSEMHKASEKLQYESAARYRDLLHSLQNLESSRRIVSGTRENADYIGAKMSRENVSVVLFAVRGGTLFAQRSLLMENPEELPKAEILSAFIRQFYHDPDGVPDRVYVGETLPDQPLIEDWLSQIGNRHVGIRCPAKGNRLNVLKLAATNAETRLKTSVSTSERDFIPNEAMLQLRDLLLLDRYPKRIEGYDIANISGTDAAGSMVVFENGEPAKKEYRIFKIKWKTTPDDYAMMREMLERRFVRYKTDPKWKAKPDLVLIDGGKGHLDVALDVLDKLDIDDISVIALAKEEELIYTEFGQNPLRLGKRNARLKLLQRVRDEAHRFANTLFKKLRRKRLTASALDSIPGLGQKRKRNLLIHFRSVDRLKAVTVEELTHVPGISASLALRIKELLK